MSTIALMTLKYPTTADHLIGSRTRARLLRVLFFSGEHRAWLRDLCRRVGTGTAPIRRELDWLTRIGLVHMYREGGAAFFEPVDNHPLLEPLRQTIAVCDDYDARPHDWRLLWPWNPSDVVGRRPTMMHMPEQSHPMNSVIDAKAALEAVSAVVAPVFLVGGSVRDSLMGRASGDFDFATPLDPDTIETRVRAAGRRPYLVGKRFGTVAFKLEGTTIEVTSFRTETYAGDDRRPCVEFVDDLTLDLSRRDFTINAMALGNEGVIDPFGGREDLAARVIRAVGDPAERFREDPVRMLRAARFSAQLGFEVEPMTVAAMQRLAHRILLVARERWTTELDKLLVAPRASDGMQLLARTDLLRYLMPELQLQVGFEQNSPYHDRTLFEHTLGVLDATAPEITMRWAALLHDSGKPFMRVEKPGRSTYARHELLGAEIVERTALYLKWGNKRRDDVRKLVAGHMSAGSPLREADDASKPPTSRG